MSYESHCKKCGAIDAQEHRARCDGCGELILRGEGPTSTVQVSRAPGEAFHSEVRENARIYCAACTEKADAALPVWACARCGHPKHMHNAGCMVVSGEPDKRGERDACYCDGFIAPEEKP